MTGRKDALRRQACDGEGCRDTEDQKDAFKGQVERHHLGAGKGAENGADAPDAVHPAGSRRPRLCRVVAGGEGVHAGIRAVQAGAADKRQHTEQGKAARGVAHRHGEQAANGVDIPSARWGLILSISQPANNEPRVPPAW